MFDRNQNIQRLANEEFDLCIIGGGASGVGCALDAALRGLKVALIEKNDFAAETSSKSTKLIHGGVRYLEQAVKNFDFAQLKQVRHGLEERHIVLSNAPHLARPLALVTPVSSWIEGLYFRIGLWIYDQFASKEDLLPKSRWLSKAETLRLIPNLNPSLHSAVQYYDGQLDDARYALALAQSAYEAGACVTNHTQVVAFEWDDNGRLRTAIVQNTLVNDPPISVKAKVFLNCTGPFADHIRLLANPAALARIRPSKGVHLTLPISVTGSDQAALLIPKTPDGRVVFAIPFDAQLLLGTTDNDYADLSKEPVLEAAEIDFLLETLQPYIKNKLDKSLVQSGFGGLRPLISSHEGNTKGLVRDHEVEHDTNSNLLSLLGGKWTTYRLMARDAVDAVCKMLGYGEKCETEHHVLAGGEHFDYHYWQQLQHDFGFDADICQHLINTYGSRAVRVANLTREHPDWSQRLAPKYPYIQAEVVYAAKYEMAMNIRDFMARRIRLEILDWQTTLDCIPETGRLMGQILHWNAEYTHQQIIDYQQIVHKFIRLNT